MMNITVSLSLFLRSMGISYDDTIHKKEKIRGEWGVSFLGNQYFLTHPPYDSYVLIRDDIYIYIDIYIYLYLLLNL